MVAVGVNFDRDKLVALCRRWRVRELSVFGSVVRADFRPDSDVDVLVVFEPDADWSLLDLVVDRRRYGLRVSGRPQDATSP
jgi:uncharacterized protein